MFFYNCVYLVFNRGLPEENTSFLSCLFGILNSYSHTYRNTLQYAPICIVSIPYICVFVLHKKRPVKNDYNSTIFNSSHCIDFSVCTGSLGSIKYKNEIANRYSSI